ncbi:Crp/Fnr family transcriptional regulator [uncultured Acetobacteroides sp.]|uniref:Crp/Fnr family transcriptional regulator n=1 Tax=uncultured Acetobacteroides sp. TaxID=1760811 RepID=UPI0029F46BEA|nr:Crp/Fnr family transcriptional regulator [uncultured Acetobacteroides sp.]
MIEQLIERIKKDEESWPHFQNSFVETKIPSRAVLLRDGEISTHIYIIKKGCLRQWFNKDGKEITLQFFFENQPVASIDSFLSNQPSLFTIESIEPSTIISVTKETFEKLNRIYPDFKDGFNEYVFKRFRNYAQLFLSRIKDSPKERYEDLIKTHPEIVRRVPQHYIASYLGITPISLSRIRNRR